jgi:hypothetical protein
LDANIFILNTEVAMGFQISGNWRTICLALVLSWALVGCDDDDDEKPTEPADTVTGHWETEYIRDHQYLEGRIFDLAYPGEIGPFDSVRVWVYEEEGDVPDPYAEEMYLDIGTSPSSDQYDKAGVLMKEVGRDQFEVLYGQDTNHCPVALVFYSGHSRAIGVRMEIKRFSSVFVPTGVVDTIGYGGMGKDTVRIIQTTSASNKPDNPAWHLMWRNCYVIRAGARVDELELRIYKCPTGSEGADSCLDYQVVGSVAQAGYIRILGLDQYNLSAEKIPDGFIDDRVEIFRPDWGLITFPEREPFNSNRTFEDAVGNRTDTLAVKVPTLYNYGSMTEKIENSVYYLELKYWIRDE